MKILELRAENIKRLTVVNIKPDGNMVEITGKNGQGKSSVLDAIWWALEGSKNIQAVPIRKGATEALIRLDLGEIKVTRTFKTKDGNYTTAIVVEQANGARFPQPQAMLDKLLGALSFDPLAFTRMKPKDQFDTLKQFVPGVDFAEIERLNETDFAKRTEVNRRLKDVNSQAAGIVIPEAAPEAMVDESALVADLEKAGEFNAAIERRKAARAAYLTETNQVTEKYRTLKSSIEDMLKEIESRQKALASLEDTIAERDEKMQKAEALPEPIDTSKVRTAISAAKQQNDAFQAAARAKDTIVRLKGEAEKLEAQSAAFTKTMQDRAAAKAKAIADAKMPIDGIAFGDGMVLLNDVPFEQASDAERLRASIAIAAAMNPKLRVIRVRDGSLLDETAMGLLAEFATANDFQIWIERVDSSGRVGFVLEDGHLKSQPEEVAAP